MKQHGDVQLTAQGDQDGTCSTDDRLHRVGRGYVCTACGIQFARIMPPRTRSPFYFEDEAQGETAPAPVDDEELTLLTRLIREGAGDGGVFKPFAVFDEPMDCIRVLTRDCSTCEIRADERLTIVRDNYRDEQVVGFNLKGVAHFCHEHGLPDRLPDQFAALLNQALTVAAASPVPAAPFEKLDAIMRDLNGMAAASGIVPPCPNCVSEHGRADAECSFCHGTGVCPSAASPVPAAEGLEANTRKRADHEARLWVRDWTDAHRDAGAREAEEWALADRLVFIQDQAVIYARRPPVAAEGLTHDDACLLSRAFHAGQRSTPIDQYTRINSYLKVLIAAAGTVPVAAVYGRKDLMIARLRNQLEGKLADTMGPEGAIDMVAEFEAALAATAPAPVEPVTPLCWVGFALTNPAPPGPYGTHYWVCGCDSRFAIRNGQSCPSCKSAAASPVAAEGLDADVVADARALLVDVPLWSNRIIASVDLVRGLLAEVDRLRDGGSMASATRKDAALTAAEPAVLHASIDPPAPMSGQSPDWIQDSVTWRGEILTGRYAHWCSDWDDLPIDETCPEWPCPCAEDLIARIGEPRCLCTHRWAEHYGPCQRPGCGCRAFVEHR